MNSWKKEVDGHIIEYRYGSTGSIDPCSLDFANKNTLWIDAKNNKRTGYRNNHKIIRRK